MGTHPRWRRCRTRRHQTGNEYSLPPARLLGARAKCVWVSLAPLSLSLSSRRKAFVTAALIFAHCDFVLLALGADSGDFVPITELGRSAASSTSRCRAISISPSSGMSYGPVQSNNQSWMRETHSVAAELWHANHRPIQMMFLLPPPTVNWYRWKEVKTCTR